MSGDWLAAPPTGCEVVRDDAHCVLQQAMMTDGTSRLRAVPRAFRHAIAGLASYAAHHLECQAARNPDFMGLLRWTS